MKALHECTQFDVDLSILSFLLQKGANINTKDTNGRTVLQNAIEQSNTHLIEYLLANDAEINVQDMWAQVAHLLFTFQHNHKMVQHLVDKGLDVNDHSWDTNSAFLMFSEKFDITMMKALLEKGADVNIREDNSYTALHYTISDEKIETMKYLIENGADVNADTGLRSLNRPIYTALAFNEIETLKYLIAHENINHQDVNKIFLRTIDKGNVELIKYCIQHGADVDAQNEYGESSLHLAASENQIAIVQYLLKNGANIHAVDNNGNTPLKIAVEKGNTEIQKLLKEINDSEPHQSLQHNILKAEDVLTKSDGPLEGLSGQTPATHKPQESTVIVYIQPNMLEPIQQNETL